MPFVPCETATPMGLSNRAFVPTPSASPPAATQLGDVSLQPATEATLARPVSGLSTRRTRLLPSSAKYNLLSRLSIIALLELMPRVPLRRAFVPAPSTFPGLKGLPTRYVTTPVLVTFRIVVESPTYIIEESDDSVQMP